MKTPVNLTGQCLADHDFFSRIVLGRTRWAAQHEIRRSVWDNRRTLIYSANAVGKTFDLGSIICEWLTCNPRGRVICTGPKFDQVRKGLWQEVRRAYFDAAGRGMSLGGTMGAHDWTIGNQWDASVLTVENINAIQGLRGSKCLIVVDEAQGVYDVDLWTALESLMTATGSRMVASGNPLRGTGRFADMAKDPEWHVIQIDGLDHPNVVTGRELIPGAITREWCDEKLASWGESDPRYIARVRGRFPEEDDFSLVSLSSIRDCFEIDHIPEEGHLGVDIARLGSDKNVLVHLRDRVVQDVEEWGGIDLMATTGRIYRAIERYGVEPKNVHLDATGGLGAGPADRLREQGLRVEAVNVGAGPENDWRGTTAKDDRFKNRRAELYWVARLLFRARAVSVPERYRHIISDLASPTWHFDSAGRIQVEAKDAIKKRIGHSPDHGDAFILALSRRGARRPRIRIV